MTSDPPTSNVWPIAGASPMTPGEVCDDVVERDRLRRRRDPARADHRGQPVDERDDRLERRAPTPDHHARSQCGHGNASPAQALPRLASTAQVVRQLGQVVPQPAQVHDLSKPGALRRAGDVFRDEEVAVLVVARAERVNQVHCDLHPGERTLCILGPGEVRLHPAHLGVGGLRALAGHCDHVVITRELRYELAPDETRGSEDRDLHAGGCAMRSTNRRLIAPCARSWICL